MDGATLSLAIMFGMLIGFALGLTGGGGSIFAVPLLVYGLSVEPHEAIGISLAAVGATAGIGLLERLRRREIEGSTGLIFAVGGMIGAPLGSWGNLLVPGKWLLVLFSVLMLVIAFRMWRRASSYQRVLQLDSDELAVEEKRLWACQRSADGKLRMSLECILVMCVVGLATGILCGFFGIGGGFIIVPALVLFSGMPIHKAVATSLLVITLVCASGIFSYLVAERPLDLVLAGLFVGGGALGMWLGTTSGRRLSGPALQKVFAASILGVAVYMVIRNLL